MASGGVNPVSEAKRVLLWTNSNPTTLSAGTVNVNMEGYDLIEIEATNTGDINRDVYFVRSRIGTDSEYVSCAISTFFLNLGLSGLNALGCMTRSAQVYLHGIVFSSGNQIYDGALYTNWDSRAVPYRIWGLKF